VYVCVSLFVLTPCGVDVQGVSTWCTPSAVWTCRLYPYVDVHIIGCIHPHQQQCVRAGCIPLPFPAIWTCRLHPSIPPANRRAVRGVSLPLLCLQTAKWTRRVYPSSTPAVWTCRVYPSPFPAVWACRVHPFIPPAKRATCSTGCIPLLCLQSGRYSRARYSLIFSRFAYHSPLNFLPWIATLAVGRPWCIPLLHLQCGRTGCISPHRLQWYVLGAPSPRSAVQTRARVYPFFPSQFF
jgi:hypothetical protein